MCMNIEIASIIFEICIVPEPATISPTSSSDRGDRGWLSHGLVVTLQISYSLDGGTLWGFTRDMRITD